MKHKHAVYLVYGMIAATIVIVGSLVMFFGGYELGVYQGQNGDTWFPHFNASSDSDGCSNSSSSELPACCSDDSDDCGVADKPVIYLYPTSTEKVHVTLQYPAGFSATVPSYNPESGWNVTAQPDGTLTNISDGTTYPYLYWEGKPQAFNFNMNQGFVVAGSQSKAFLTKELPIIGLNTNETNAFIGYWLPKLEGNKYTLIHFAGSEYTSVAKLTITPTPESLLRVFMVEKPITQPVHVSPQTFPSFHRVGFTAVEWGGTVIQ